MDDIRTPTGRKWRGPVLIATACGMVLACLGILGSVVRISRADLQTTGRARSSALDEKSPDAPAGDLQVTVIGILVTPSEKGAAIDQRLARIKNQLRKLIPGDHVFKLLDVRSDHIATGQNVRCDLGKTRQVRVTLVDPLDPEGKVKLRYELSQGEKRLAASEVATPLNQLFFCEHTLDDGSKLLMGIGAR